MPGKFGEGVWGEFLVFKSVTLIGMSLVFKYLGTVLAVALTVRLVPGVSMVGGLKTLLLVSLVWSLIVLLIRPILKILTLPINLLTIGLFSFVLNALLFWAMTLLVPGFIVAGFVAALVGAFVLSILTYLLEKVF